MTNYSFPLIIADGKVVPKTYSESLQDGLKSLLHTEIKTRYFNCSYGSKIIKLIEEPNDSILMALIRRDIIKILSTWEKRIEIDQIEIVKTSPIGVQVIIIYRILGFGETIDLTLQFKTQ